MRAFAPFLVVPLLLFKAVSIGGVIGDRILPRPQPLIPPKVADLPPNLRELLTTLAEEETPSLRLAALMPSHVIDRVVPPPPPPPGPRTAAESHRLRSVMLADGLPASAVIDDRVVQEGERIGAYRLARVAADHVILAGPGGRERVGLEGPPSLAVAAAVPRAGTPRATPAETRGSPSLPPAPDAMTLERQFRRLLENLGH